MGATSQPLAREKQFPCRRTTDAAGPVRPMLAQLRSPRVHLRRNAMRYAARRRAMQHAPGRFRAPRQLAGSRLVIAPIETRCETVRTFPQWEN